MKRRHPFPELDQRFTKELERQREEALQKQQRFERVCREVTYEAIAGKYSNVIHVPSAELRKHFAGSQLFVNGMNV